MHILGIESSCDDTSIALLEATEQGFTVLAEKTASQIPVHQKYGGVVPEIAGRMHAENILPVVEEVMKGFDKPDVIAVTSGPGLITGLLIGVEVAKTLSYLWDVPLVSVNHIAGHIHSVELKTQNSNVKTETQNRETAISFPALCLVVSGGHTELILMKDATTYELIGKTRDDAAGECFDKVAKLLGFEYPGGPKISQFAAEGNSQAIQFPRPMLSDPNFDFSFAGLKTAALYWLRDHTLAPFHMNPIALPAGIFGQLTDEITIHDFCASFEAAIIDVLVTKTLRAAKKYQPKTIILGGGVSANKKLRLTLEKTIQENTSISYGFGRLTTSFLSPISAYCMDNGAMIAAAGYYQAIQKNFTPWQKVRANPNWEVYDVREV